MTPSPLERFQAWLEDQGLPKPDAGWLAKLYVELARRLGGKVGMGAAPEGEKTWVYFQVPDREDGLRLELSALKRLPDPVQEVEDLIRKQLLG